MDDRTNQKRKNPRMHAFRADEDVEDTIARACRILGATQSEAINRLIRAGTDEFWTRVTKELRQDIDQRANRKA